MLPVKWPGRFSPATLNGSVGGVGSRESGPSLFSGDN